MLRAIDWILDVLFVDRFARSSVAGPYDVRRMHRLVGAALANCLLRGSAAILAR